MAGVKGKSGAPGVTRKAGPGVPPKKFTLEVARKYGVAIHPATGGFEMQQIEVVEMDRKTVTIKLENGDRMIIFR